MLDDKFFDEENKKIITERMEKSIETLKELAKGTRKRNWKPNYVRFFRILSTPSSDGNSA